jgi:hypothetical protein
MRKLSTILLTTWFALPTAYAMEKDDHPAAAAAAAHGGAGSSAAVAPPAVAQTYTVSETKKGVYGRPIREITIASDDPYVILGELFDLNETNSLGRLIDALQSKPTSRMDRESSGAYTFLVRTLVGNQESSIVRVFEKAFIYRLGKGDHMDPERTHILTLFRNNVNPDIILSIIKTVPLSKALLESVMRNLDYMPGDRVAFLRVLEEYYGHEAFALTLKSVPAKSFSPVIFEDAPLLTYLESLGALIPAAPAEAGNDSSSHVAVPVTPVAAAAAAGLKLPGHHMRGNIIINAKTGESVGESDGSGNLTFYKFGYLDSVLGAPAGGGAGSAH